MPPTPSRLLAVLLSRLPCVSVVKVHMLKERPFWSKVSLFWTFRLADVEGDNGGVVVVALVFDSWTGSVSSRMYVNNNESCESCILFFYLLFCQR